MGRAPKVTFESLSCVFEFFGVSGSVGALLGRKDRPPPAFPKFPLKFPEMSLKLASCDTLQNSRNGQHPEGDRNEIQVCIN